MEQPNAAVSHGILTKLGRIRVMGIVRVALYVCFAVTVVCLVVLRSAWADFKESTLKVGRELSQLEGLTGDKYRVRLNGESVFISSTVVDEPVNSILDRVERACRSRAGALPEAWKQVPESMKRDQGISETDAAALGVMRKQIESEGEVACLAQPQGRDFSAMVQQIREALQTGDLSRVGHLRYVYARKTKTGRSHVIVAWTEGAFNVFHIVPPKGGEPAGTDSANVPRPEGATRILTAEIDGAPHAVRVYDVPRPDSEVLAAYEPMMARLGFQAISLEKANAPYARAYTKDGVDTLIFAFPSENKTMVSIVETVSH